MLKHMKSLSLLILFAGLGLFGWSQPCTNLGQTPETAFPVCGTSTFQQSNVPICASIDVYVPGCSRTTGNYQNKNPYYYRFTCFQGGTLGFVIVPNNQGDDYDWQLYDITGINPANIFTSNSAVVTGNWSGSYGNTGASANGVNYIQCASNPSDNMPTFSAMPVLIQGHEYILLVSHFTDSQSGYSLSFGGGTAVITDPTEPHMASVTAACDGMIVKVRLNKRMKCNSVALNGSDFIITGYAGTIISAAGRGCSSSFDMEEVELKLSAPITPGNYQVIIKNGSDGNTLKDNCDRQIPVNETLPLEVLPNYPTPMDSITIPGCAPTELELVFKKPINCASISADGSDFTITGPSPVNVTGFRADCDSGFSNIIHVLLDRPLVVGGTYFISIQIGNDGNTAIDECGQYVPDTTIAFTIKDTVNAGFSYNINYGCEQNIVTYTHNGNGQTNSWLWTFGGAGSSTIRNPVITYSLFNPTTTTLIVSNGVCSDTSRVLINFDNLMSAGFNIPAFLCPQDALNITNTSLGNISSWQWSFDNGSTFNGQNPPAQYYPTRDVIYNATITQIITNPYGCSDTLSKVIRIINNCYIAVPNAFTPNGDGLNDYLYPLNAYKALDLTFCVYNRFGQLIYRTNDWTRKWDGQFKGRDADPGTYVWTLTYTHADDGRRIEQKGTVILIR